MTKYFQFLDNVDGANDESLDSTKLDVRFQSLDIVDNGNQTFKFTGYLQGPGDTTGGDKLDGDIVKWSVDGNATALSNNTNDAGNIIVDGSGSGRKKYRAMPKESSGAGKGMIINNSSHKVLTAGEHTLVCTLYNEAGTTATAATITKKFDIARSVITMTPTADFLKKDNTNGQIDIDLTEIGVVGTRPGETLKYNPASTSAGGDAGSKHAVKITATFKTVTTADHADDAAAALAAEAGPFAALDLANTDDGGESSAPNWVLKDGHSKDAVADLLLAQIASGKTSHIKLTVTAMRLPEGAADAIPNYVSTGDTFTDSVTVKRA